MTVEGDLCDTREDKKNSVSLDSARPIPVCGCVCMWVVKCVMSVWGSFLVVQQDGAPAMFS